MKSSFVSLTLTNRRGADFPRRTMCHAINATIPARICWQLTARSRARLRAASQMVAFAYSTPPKQAPDLTYIGRRSLRADLRVFVYLRDPFSQVKPYISGYKVRGIKLSLIKFSLGNSGNKKLYRTLSRMDFLRWKQVSSLILKQKLTVETITHHYFRVDFDSLNLTRSAFEIQLPFSSRKMMNCGCSPKGCHKA